MVRTASTMVDLGSPLPEFNLPNVDGRMVASCDFAEQPALLVIFLCNHCPYVKHLRTAVAEFAREFQPRGLAIVGISSNDATSHPDDGPQHMKAEAASAGYVFPYLYDESQAVATAFQAACTPDFFLYDKHRRLAYRGQFDASRPGNAKPITGADLRAAVEAVLAGQPAPQPQRASLGCNIKWKPGREPAYFTGVPAVE